MRLATYVHQGSEWPAVVVDDDIIDLGTAAPDLPGSVSAILALPDGRDAVAEAVRHAPERRALSEVTLGPPVRPQKFYGIGLNPLGPWLVTPDELPDPHNLAFRTLVNGEVRQQSNTNNLIHDCWKLIAELSTACTLEPGDVIATGTCAGVGAFYTPPRWLVAGDVVRVEFDGIGVIENRVVAQSTNGASPQA
jgi:hypothetical protein